MFVCRVCVEQNVYLEVRLNTQLLHQYRKICVLKKSTLQKVDLLDIENEKNEIILVSRI